MYSSTSKLYFSSSLIFRFVKNTQGLWLASAQADSWGIYAVYATQVAESRQGSVCPSLVPDRGAEQPPAPVPLTPSPAQREGAHLRAAGPPACLPVKKGRHFASWKPQSSWEKALWVLGWGGRIIAPHSEILHRTLGHGEPGLHPGKHSFPCGQLRQLLSSSGLRGRWKD